MHRRATQLTLYISVSEYWRTNRGSGARSGREGGGGAAEQQEGEADGGEVCVLKRRCGGKALTWADTLPSVSLASLRVVLIGGKGFSDCDRSGLCMDLVLGIRQGGWLGRGGITCLGNLPRH